MKNFNHYSLLDEPPFFSFLVVQPKTTYTSNHKVSTSFWAKVNNILMDTDNFKKETKLESLEEVKNKIVG